MIRNLINDPSFCKACGLLCDYYKMGAYSHINRIRAAIKLPAPEDLPAFVEEPSEHLPRKVPHADLLLGLPSLLSSAGVKTTNRLERKRCLRRTRAQGAGSSGCGFLGLGLTEASPRDPEGEEG